jgi:CubicO group peptidase (beta-lactamase class C family)
MTDTGFAVPDDEQHRLPALYTKAPDGSLRANAAFAATGTRMPTMLSGGGGLVASAGDYHRFTQMLLRGGELDGVRLLSPRTVALMTSNHLPGNADLENFGRKLFAESTNVGVGFGLGFSVVLDPVAGKALTSAGEYAWGGMASTAFYVDPAEEITAMFFTQLVPSSTYPIRPQLRTLVTQAVVD